MTAAEIVWPVLSLIASFTSMIYCVASIVRAVEMYGDLWTLWDSIDFFSKILLVIVAVLVVVMALGIVMNVLILATLFV